MSASAQSRSMMPCSSGASSRRDLAGPHRLQRERVGVVPLEPGDADARDADEDGDAPAEVGAAGVHQADHERDEQRTEQEHDQGHPRGQAAVVDEAGAGHQPGISPSSLSSSRTSSSVASDGGRIRSESSSDSSGSGTPPVRTASSSAARVFANDWRSPASTAASTAASSALSAGSCVVGDVPLPLAEDPDDHAWPSSFRGSLTGVASTCAGAWSRPARAPARTSRRSCRP